MRYLPCLLILLLPLAGLAAAIEAKISDAGGKALADAVIFAEPVAGKAPRGKLTAIIDQVDKEFVPYVSIMQTGTSVTFPNKDNTRHQVYSFSPAKTFNLKLYAGNAAEPVVFDKPGAVTMGCNIHDWMLAYVYVVDTPWFGKSDEKGVAKIADLPAGEYHLKAWHPQLNGEPLSQTLKVAGGEARAAFQLTLSGKAAK